MFFTKYCPNCNSIFGCVFLGKRLKGGLCDNCIADLCQIFEPEEILEDLCPYCREDWLHLLDALKGGEDGEDVQEAKDPQ
jgi:hypothetical protein